MLQTIANPEAIRDRFMSKVRVVGDCWEWQGVTNSQGYGRWIFADRRSANAHRVSYILHVGRIPDGLVLDHLCRNIICVNPDHLDPVTQRENLLRGFSPMAVARRTGRCKRGHIRSPENVNRAGRCKRCDADRCMELRREREAADPALREARLKRVREYGRARRRAQREAI